MEKVNHTISNLLIITFLCGGFTFSFFYNGIDGDFLFATYLCITIASLTYVFGIIRQERIVLCFGPFVFLLLSFWALAFINLIFTISFFNSYIHLWVLSTFPLIFLLSITQNTSQEYGKLLLMMFACIIVFISLWALYQIFSDPYSIRFRAVGPFFNPNSLAGLLNLFLLPLAAIFLTSHDKKTYYHYILFAALIIILAAMMATVGRGAVISSALSFILLVLLLQKNPNFKFLYASMIGVIAAFLYWFFHIFFYSFKTNSPASATDSFGARIQTWEKSLEILLTNPITGYGLANFQFIYPQYRYDTETSKGIFVHMDPLQFGIEMGIIAPILFYALLVTGLIRFVKVFRQAKNYTENYALIVGCFCGIVALLFHTHFTFHLYILPTLMALGAISGIWYFATSDALQENKVEVVLSSKSKVLLSITTIMFFITALHGASQLSVTEHFHSKAEKAWEQDGDIYAFVRLNNFASLYALGSDPNPFLNIAKMQTALIQSPEFPKSEKEKLLESTLQLYDIAQQLNPYEPAVFFNRGLFFETLPAGLISNKNEKAMEQWQKAYELNSRYEPVLKKVNTK